MRVLDHLHENGLQECLQSACNEHHNCETALVRVQNDILRSVDDNRCVILLLLDMSAAFDTVDHSILVKRLQSRYGISGSAFAWFDSFLKDRTQFVKIGGTSSSVWCTPGVCFRAPPVCSLHRSGWRYHPQAWSVLPSICR